MSATTGKGEGRVWQALCIDVETDLADAVGSFLLDAGAPGLETTDTDSGVRITAHFADTSITDHIEDFFDQLAHGFPGSRRPSYHFAAIEETDWSETWKEHFPPLPVGHRLFVYPPWVNDVPPGRVGIELDPGMAFGTGHHASTRGCLTALDEIIDPAKQPKVLDLGTGSGILAIAAIKLGANSALAVDIDTDACEIARANARANRVDQSIEVSSRLDPDRVRFDVVVANIFSGMLIGFANDIARRLEPGGIAIGSGLETTEATGVAQAWTAATMTEIKQIEIDGWTTLVFRRNESTVDTIP